jgi:phytoene dehydrogenase-like protein
MRVAANLGQVGLPDSLENLARKRWDSIIVGGGHNGLTCAYYLAKAGQQVLLFERRERLGGACTLERPFPDPNFITSPCAYVVGPLDQRVIDELALKRRGLKIFLANPQLFAPFPDGSSFAMWLEADKTQASLEALGVSRRDQAGFWAYEEVFDDIRKRLRLGERDAWLGDSPSRAELEALLGHDPWLIDIVFNASVAEVLQHYISDTRLHDALYGQGIIGNCAGPHTQGTALVKLMHYMGDLEGQGPCWGYVAGGMGMISFLIAEAAQEAGAVLCCGTPVAEILPGEGVRLEGGEVFQAKHIITNADPKRTLKLLAPGSIPEALRARLEAWKVTSPVVKFNAALSKLPTFSAAKGDPFPYRSTITATLGMAAGQRAFEDFQAGYANIGFAEIYFQTYLDATPAPAGQHLLSVFAHYAPYAPATGSWDSERERVARQVITLISTFAPDFADCLRYTEVLGPSDIEARIGLTGGHIFQGDTQPDQMWDQRLSARSGVAGLYFCGAATHPGGSVIALNGRNAAMAVLEDVRASA